MNIKQQTSKEYLTSIKIVYYALVGGQILFGLVSFYLRQYVKFDIGAQELRNLFIYIVPMFLVGGIAGGHIIFKNKLITAKSKLNLNEKMIDYRSALLIKYALLEGPSFLSIIVYLLTGDILFLGMAALIIIFFFTIAPTIDRAVNDLELNLNDEQSLRN